MRTNIISCLGKPVSVFEFGDTSHPDLLLIHGNSAHSGFFAPIISLLETKYHIITFDLPGHRESEVWAKEDFTRENFAFLFNSVCNHFELKEIGAFGFSLGGFLLMECFDLLPALKKIAVAGHPPLSSVTDMPEAYYLNDDMLLYFKGSLSKSEVERIYNAVIAIKDSRMKTEIQEALLKTNPIFREGCLLLGQKLEDQIARVNNSDIPIAVIHAENDLAVRLQFLEKLKIRNLWGEKIQIMSDCGHFMIIEKPIELANMLDSFFMDN